VDNAKIKYLLLGLFLGAGAGYGLSRLIPASPAVAPAAQADAAKKPPAPPLAPENMRNMPDGHPPLDGGDATPAEPGVTPSVGEARRVADSDIGNYDAQMTAAALLYRDGNKEQSLEYLKRANNIRPESLDSLQALGVTHSEIGKFDEAISWLNKALAKNPSSAETRVEIALVHIKQKHFDKAAQELDRALQADASYERALEIAARTHIQLKNWAKAQEHINRLSAINPGNPALPQLSKFVTEGKKSS
jgi:tetratricopeptide (TPR) repeat protein